MSAGKCHAGSRQGLKPYPPDFSAGGCSGPSHVLPQGAGYPPHRAGCAIVTEGRPRLARADQRAPEKDRYGVHSDLLNQARRISVQAMLVLLPMGLVGCSSSSLPIHPSIATCEADDQSMVRDTLYFGRNRPSGGPVREAEWLHFLNEIVTPRFPDGLTVVKATGQWRNAHGRIE